MSAGKVLLGVIAGVAAGALLGVLFAPEKGLDTRKKISRKEEDLAGSLKEKFSKFLDTISGKFEMAKDEVTDIADNFQAKSEEIKKEVKTARN